MSIIDGVRSLLGGVERAGAVGEERGDTGVGEVEHHSRGCVLQVVAVVHPDPRVVGAQRDLPDLAWLHVEGV